jgi:hypothetical protein
VTISRLWAFLAVGLPVLAATISNLSTVDLAYHLRAGGSTLDTGTIPAVDTFTFTANGVPWLNQQWAAQVLLAAVYRLGGWSGLVVLRAVLVGLLTVCLYVACRRQGVNPRTAAWLTLGAFAVGSVAFTLRPQFLGMALLAVLLFLVVERRSSPRWLWLAVPLTVLWANVHGSFVIAPLVLGLSWIQDLADRSPFARQTLIVTVLTGAATLVNPFGPDVWRYAAGLSTNSFITSQIVEWQPTSLRTPPGIVFFGSALVVAFLLATRKHRPAWPTLLWLGAFFLVGAYAIRGVAWWSLAAAFALAGVLAADDGSTTRETTEPVRRTNLAVAGMIVAVTIALLPFWRPIDAGLAAPAGVVGYAPSGISGHLRSTLKPGDRLFAPQPWGSWFEFAFPFASVAVDSRIEMFPASVWDDYDKVIAGEAEAKEILTSWGVSVVVARDDNDFGLIEKLTGDPEWRQAYQDETGRVFVRTSADG